MMGRVRAASERGVHVLRLEGDVRLTMCIAIERHIQRVLDDPQFLSIWVDLSEAEGLDSTTLGVLAQLAIQTEARYGFKPAIYSSSPSIERLLATMGFAQLFEMRSGCPEQRAAQTEIPAVVGTEADMKAQVLAAHRTLMSISSENKAAFRDLVRTLEHS